MKNKVLLVTLVSLFLFVFQHRSAKAQVVINEFSSYTSSDWVEIYNIGPKIVDLSNYIIRDSTETNKINLSGNIDVGEFISFGFSNRLNKDEDVVKLLKAENESETLIDSVAYGGEGQVCVPETDSESIGRVTDGGYTIERFKTASRDGSNMGVELDPCPTPTLLPTNTSTPTPKPISTPKPTSTPKPASTSTPTPTIKPTITNTTTPTLIEETLGIFQSETNDSLAPTNNTPEPQVLGAKEDVDRKKFPLAPIFMVLGGLIIMVAPFFNAIKSRFKKLK